MIGDQRELMTMNLLLRRLFRRKTIYQLLHLVKLLAALLHANIVKSSHEKQRIWLIAERSGEARDNGYHLFKYIRSHYPDLPVYYVIEDTAPDRIKIQDMGNLISFGSYQHYLYYVLALRLISTHRDGAMPDEIICRLVQRWIPASKYQKSIFLQHGIIKDYLPQLSFNEMGADLFVCGALPEYEFVNERFGYSNHEVRYLGLARFDQLHTKNVKRQILLMPTFRMWLYQDPLAVASDAEQRFLESEYYRTYQSLLQNRELIKLLEDSGYELIFYPHYELQRYLHLFSVSSEWIHLASKDDYDVQELLMESALLITDYSSVFFDFAYMRKPVIYYQFDYERFKEEHYAQGYFDYERDGFGPIAATEAALLEQWSDIAKRDYLLDPIFKQKADAFFPLHDRENCKRNFEAIRSLS